MPKRKLLKNRNEEQSPSTNELQLQQPPGKMTRTVKGKQREYDYLTVVKSFEELDELRFQKYCRFPTSRNTYKNKLFMSFIIPCTRQRSGKPCNYELRAVRPYLGSDNFYVYAHSQHNHHLESQVRRTLKKSEKDLKPDDCPPEIFHTSDNIEWTFLETLPDHDKMDKFRCNNKCISKREKSSQIRGYCTRRRVDNCKFMLLAVKTEKQCYHVYKYGKHTCKETASNENGSISTNPSAPFRTPDNIEWTFLKTFPNYDKMSEFRCDNSCNSRSRSDDEKRGRIRYYCVRRFACDQCKFILLAVKTEKNGYQVYKNGKHTHPMSNYEKRRKSVRGKQNMNQQEQMAEADEEEEVDVPMEEEEQQDENEPIEPEQQNAEEEGSSAEESEEETMGESEEETTKEDEIRREEEEVEVPMEEREQHEEDEPIGPEAEEQHEEEEGSPYEESDEESVNDEEATRREAEEAEPIEQLLIKGRNEKVHKWMAKIDQSQIGATITGMDKWDLLRLVEMADQEIQDNEARLEFWQPWMKCAIRRLLPQIQGFNMQFTKLILMVM